jgi:glycosyltransferase involved in cell wall biosynthesis
MLMRAKSPKLVLVTPARNEAAFIEGTLRSVAAQTALPARWIIVSDGSTDGTDDLVLSYAARHAWIELVRMGEHGDRHFAAKAKAFNAGYARLKGMEYHIIGNLDADITFDPEYFAFLLGHFEANPRLGVAGTPFVDDFDNPADHTYAHDHANLNHVSGACQLFRRECFDQIGGYIPVRGGAIDWIAVTTARMKGWQTRTFTEKVCYHHRKLGTGTGNHDQLRMRFHYGLKAYYVGGHPIWELVEAKCEDRFGAALTLTAA